MGPLRPAAWVSVGATPIAALLLGAHVPVVVLAWAVGGYGLLAARGPRKTALLVFVLVVTASVQAPSLLSLRALGALAVALAATLPVWVATGGRIPWQAWVSVAAAVLLAAAAVWWWPWRAAVLAADVATGTQVLLLAASGLVAVAAVTAWSGHEARD